TALAEFRRQGMSAEIRRYDFQFLYRPHCFEHAYLGIQREAIAALRFNRCRAEFQEPLCKPDANIRIVSDCFDAGKNPAAACEDVNIGSALNPPFELICARAGKHCMGMGIDKTR